MIPRFPLRFALWLNPGESPFKMNAEHLLWFAEFIKQAEKGSSNGKRKHGPDRLDHIVSRRLGN